MSRGIRLTCTDREDNEVTIIIVIYAAGIEHEVERLVNYKGRGADNMVHVNQKQNHRMKYIESRSGCDCIQPWVRIAPC